MPCSRRFPLAPKDVCRTLWIATCIAAALGLPLPTRAHVEQTVIGKEIANGPVTPMKAAATQTASKPSWAELNLTQQQTLKPLATSWNGINEAQKRKWLEVSKNYSKLSPAEQIKMQSRMVGWVAMSSQDRAAARLNFAKTKELSKELTGEEKKAKWETYQALSAEEKAKLAATASPKPAGAATAVKPVAPQKLAVSPKSAPLLPKLAVSAPITTAVESMPTATLAPTN